MYIIYYLQMDPLSANENTKQCLCLVVVESNEILLHFMNSLLIL